MMKTRYLSCVSHQVVAGGVPSLSSRVAMSSEFPFKWRPATEEEAAERRRLYRNPLSTAVDVVFSEPGKYM